MEKTYLLLRVEVLLPDDGDIKSHIHRFTYAVVPKFFGYFEDFIKSKFDFYSIDMIFFFTSDSHKYASNYFTRL